MRGRSKSGSLLVAAAALTLATWGLALPVSASSPPLASVVSQVPVSWTPNVSADSTVGQEGSGSACNSTYFGSGNLSCQSEVYSTAYVNGDVIVAGAFTEACQPGKYSQGLCTAGTQVTRDDIFAYKAGTGLIDPDFTPVVNAGPVWSAVAGPAGSNTVYLGGAFSTVDGATHKGIVQLNVNPGVTTGATADGSVVTAFKGSVSNTVRAMALSPDGKALYLGGQFDSVDSTTKFADGDAVAGLARLNAKTGAVDSSFGFALGDPISGLPIKAEAISLSPNGDELAVSGTALEVNGQARPRLAVINTGGTLGAASALADFTAPILSNDCSAEHDYVRSVAFSTDGTFLVVGDTGYQNDGSQPYSACDAVARFDVNAADTTTTGTSVDVPPAWINYGGGDSFYSVAVAGDVVYAGGHNRWVNNYCGNNYVCEPNAVLVDGLSALDANTGLALAWWHPETLRGDGTMYLGTFAAGSYDGTKPGLALGTDVDLIAGDYHSENALFPLAATTSPYSGGPIPSGLFNEEGGSNTGTPLCVDDAGDSATAGAPVELSACLNDAEQNWTLNSGAIQLNGLCLDTASGGTSTGSLVVLNTCKSGTTTQQWSQGAGNTVVNTGASSADGTPMCLDDPGSATTGGTQLDVAACSGGQNQVWPLPSAQGPPSPPATGSVFSQELQADTQVPCLDDTGDGTAAGTKVQVWTCYGDAEQQWTVEADGTLQVNGDHCLDSAGGATSSGTLVVLDPCSGAASQLWTPGPNYSLVQQASGLCLTEPNSDPVNGEQMQIATCTGGNNQTWRLPTD